MSIFDKYDKEVKRAYRQFYISSAIGLIVLVVLISVIFALFGNM